MVELPEVKRTPSRFRNAIGKYRLRRTSVCVACGTCAHLCAYGVHIKRNNKMATPRDYLCIGYGCNKCVEECPENALSMEINPLTGVIGDRRWTPDLLISAWYMAETGEAPGGDIEYKVGDSGGGVDKLRFCYKEKLVRQLDTDSFSTRISLNKRQDNRADVEIGIPIYGGGMSYGSVSLKVLVGRARAWKAWDAGLLPRPDIS